MAHGFCVDFIKNVKSAFIILFYYKVIIMQRNVTLSEGAPKLGWDQINK